jgi:hypothetical protein
VARERLPNRRECEGFDVEALGLHFHATVGRFTDGRVAEVSSPITKPEAWRAIMVSDSAVLCSLALQYGVPIDVIRHALMRDGRGNASGPMGVVLDRLAAEEEPE